MRERSHNSITTLDLEVIEANRALEELSPYIESQNAAVL